MRLLEFLLTAGVNNGEYECSVKGLFSGRHYLTEKILHNLPSPSTRERWSLDQLNLFDLGTNVVPVGKWKTHYSRHSYGNLHPRE